MTVRRLVVGSYSLGRAESLNARNNIGILVLLVAGGGGDVPTSSVNELYLSGGFRPRESALFFLRFPSLSSRVHLPPMHSVSHCPTPLSTRSHVPPLWPARSLSPYEILLRSSLCRENENSRYAKSALSKLAYSTYSDLPELFMSPLKSQPGNGRIATVLRCRAYLLKYRAARSRARARHARVC